MEPAKASTRVPQPVISHDRHVRDDRILRRQGVAGPGAIHRRETAMRFCSAAIGAIRAKLAADTAA